ncbi:MAG: hypothetical protein PVF83_10725 [Anaerolineales bacterium]|jgi:hypothetical protein
MTLNNLENQLTLLTIRCTGRRRDTLIAGGIFLVFFLSVFAFGMLDRLTGRALLFVSMMTVVFGFAYLTAWVKLQVVKGSIELIETLLREEKQ